MQKETTLKTVCFGAKPFFRFKFFLVLQLRGE